MGFFLVLGYEICWVANDISFDYALTQKKPIFLWIFKKEIFLIYTVLVSLWFFEIYRYYTGGFQRSWRVHDKSNQSTEITEITVRSITTQRFTSHTGTEHSQSEIDDDGNFLVQFYKIHWFASSFTLNAIKRKGGGAS